MTQEDSDKAVYYAFVFWPIIGVHKLLCKSGRYQNAIGSTVCRTCDVGMFQSEQNSTTCHNCSLGTFQNKTESTACLQCASGTFAIVRGVTVCQVCQPGSQCPNKDKNSEFCEVGSFSNATLVGVSHKSICMLSECFS